MTYFFNQYWKIWRPSSKDINNKLKNILMYLHSTQNLCLLTMSEKFEEYIGPLEMISDVKDKKGLHKLTEGFIEDLLIGNKKNIKVLIRDMKIKELL
jgi:hypothetical protein